VFGPAGRNRPEWASSSAGRTMWAEVSVNGEGVTTTVSGPCGRGALARWRPWLVVGVLVMAAIAVHAALRPTAALEILEAKTLDWRVQAAAPLRSVDSPVVLFLLDQTSLDHFERVEGLTWPWPRDVWGSVIEFCRAGGVRAVVFDVLFTSVAPCDPAYDDAFGRALARAPAVVLAASFRLARPDELVPPLPADIGRFAVSTSGDARGQAREANLAHLPVTPLRSAVGWLGDAAAEPDADGVFRRVPMLTRVGDHFLPSVPLAAVLASSSRREVVVGEEFLTVGQAHVPLDDGSMLVRFHRADPQSEESGLRSSGLRAYPIGNIVLSQRSLEAGERPAVAPEELRDAVVFVGFSAPGLGDVRPTPISPVMPGVEINAIATDNILANDHLVRAPAVASLALLAVAVAAAALLATRVQKISTSLFGLLGAALAVVTVTVAAFRFGLWLDLAAPLVGLGCSFAAASAYSYATEGRQRRFLRRVLSLYNSESVVEEVIRDPSRLALGGEKRSVTVFFSDIAGFTSLAEALAPEDLVDMLKEYLDAMTQIILDQAGTVDKYIGDAIMAFWGAPLPAPDHAVRACTAALGNQRRLATLRADLEHRGLPPIHTRIGLNSGEASVGNFGSTARFSYTAMGDNVNLASRLEGVNKAYHTEVLISESTFEAARAAIEVREVDLIKVKGKERAIHIYELLGLKGELTTEALAPYRLFEQGVALYRARLWDDACATFDAVLERRSDDGPSQVFRERCRLLKLTPPPQGWDGSYTMTEK
jgi:adenylate cyclase